jgi:AraC-like DNA-binding protein
MLDFFLGFGLCACALLAALTLGRRPLSGPDALLAGWLASYALFFFGWIGAPRAPGGVGFMLAALASSSVMLTPVFLWLYARAIAGVPVKRRWPHFLPAALNLVLMTALAIFARAVNTGGAISVSLPLAMAPLAVAPGVFLLAVSTYPALAFRTVAPHEKALKNTLSNEKVAAFGWVRAWAAATIALNLALIAVSIASNTGAASVDTITTIAAAAVAAQIVLVAYKGMRARVIVVADTPAEIASEQPPPRLEAFETHMADAKPFLDPELSIEVLAGQLGWPREEVTRAVRARDANFFDCINRHRVEEAKRLIADPANRNISLLSLGMDAGFGSKSAFNAAFRRHLGMTPSKYRADTVQAKPLN